MGDHSKIEWTDATWNATKGCSRISEGCVHCYAERDAIRMSGPGKPYEGLVRSTPDGPRWTGVVRLDEKALGLPLRWRKGRRIFVNSMSDLFHEALSDRDIERVFEVMCAASHHTFQVLTKRAERMRDFMTTRKHFVRPNIWLGVSVENGARSGRIQLLQQTNAAVRFLSIEPLIGPIENLPLEGIHWVIVGGESGPHARPMDLDWVRSIRDRCVTAGVAFFFKQIGGVHKKEAGRLLDGRTWDEFPVPAMPVVT